MLEGDEHYECKPKEGEKPEEPVLFPYDISDQRAHGYGYFPKSQNVHFIRRLPTHHRFRVTANDFGCAA